MDSAKPKKNLFSGKLFSKLKAVKHIEIYIAILACAVILLIYFSGFGSNQTAEDVEYVSINAYAAEMEQKLQRTLSGIAGAGDVKVMITFESGLERIIAYSSEEKETTTTNSNGTTTTVTVVQTPIIVGQGSNSGPILLGEKLPKPLSVLVVASGASDTKVKLSLLLAVETLLKVPAGNIQILC
ncbi:MAG: hypothetical protein LBN07_02275 [Christensenellaceae bacterium]|jgi:stage III sporulation protein AG|nr:hypothetical protein [Christensenellaceae bacterium]